MSYDISIIDNKTNNIIESSYPEYIDGYDYSKPLYLSITFNYSSILSKAFNNKKGIYLLNNRKVSDTINIIEIAINRLKNEINDDYWSATEGNVKFALLKLYQMSLLGQGGVWKIQ